MKTLQIDEKKARELYKTASPEFKAALKDIFGEKFFEFDYRDIKTVNDAYEACGLIRMPNYMFALGLSDDEVAYRDLKIVTKAINNGWMPDWENQNQHKYVANFLSVSGGFVFFDERDYTTYVDVSSVSHLCFESAEKAEYAGRQFTELYKRFIM